MEIMARPSNKEEIFGQDNGLIHEAVITGRKVGAGRKFWSSLAHNQTLFEEVVDLVNRGGLSGPTTYLTKAEKIMGPNLFGPGEAKKYFGITLLDEQISSLAEIPYPETVLRELKGTHILVATFPLSILDIREKFPKIFATSPQEYAWYAKQSFAIDKGKAEWFLVRKKPLYANALTENMEVPTARVMTYCIIGHLLATGKRLVKNHVRVSPSGTSEGIIALSVGFTGPLGFSIMGISKCAMYEHIPLASVYKQTKS